MVLTYKPRVLLIASVLAVTAKAVLAQDGQEPMQVERIDVVDQSKPVYNIHIDEENRKWIANSEMVYQVVAKDAATPIRIPDGQQSLLQLPGGDIDVRWNKEELKKILGEALVTTAAYEKSTRTLWIGTDGYGVFKVRVDNGLTLLEEIYINNSKLRSDFINSIYIAPTGKVWIGTEDGALLYDNGDSKMFQKFFNIQTISGNRRETWATGDNIVWLIDSRDNWTPIEINMREIEGQMHDIALDGEGNIWIASNIMTAYNIADKSYRRFGPGQYFTSQFVNYVSVDDDGTIWVGTDDKGVYIIEKESTMTLIAEVTSPLSCEGTLSNAEISARAVGGEEPYSFTWSDGTTASTLGNVGIGTYSVTVTDAEGNEKSAEIIIPDPRMEISASMTQQESGQGAADGIAEVVITGGSGDYNIQWSNGATGMTASNLSAGSYSVTATDENGCSASSEVVISRPVMELMSQIEILRDFNCPDDAGAAIRAVVSGGREPYTYSWQGIEGTSAELDAVRAGTYSLTVTDASGTTVESQVTINAPRPFSAEVVIEQTASSNESDGQAFVVVAGGTEPYTYLWSTGETNEMAIALDAVEHTVTVTDTRGCTAVASVLMTEELLPLNVSLSQIDDILCPGEQTASMNIEVSGGKAPFSFAWSSNIQSAESLDALGAGIYSVTVTDGNGNTAMYETEITEPEPIVLNILQISAATPGSQDGSVRAEVAGGSEPYTYRWQSGATTATAEGLAPGEYGMTVTDVNGCTADKQFTVSEEILPLTAELLQVEEVLCAGETTGSLAAEAAGGKGPFSYAWSNGATTEIVDNLGAGLYTVSVTDALGEVAVFESEIPEPEPLLANVIIESNATTGSANGIASIEAIGGVGEYTYTWEDDVTDARRTDLAPGEYALTVTDANGCTVTTLAVISENILPLTLSLSQGEEILCAGDQTTSLTPEINGGKGPFSYLWSDGSTGSLLEQIGAGAYALTISDAVGNNAVVEAEIVEPPALIVNAVARNSASPGGEDAQALAEVTGGNSPYQYAWDNGETTDLAVSLAPGVHSVTVTDAYACTAVAEVEVSETLLPLTVALAQVEEILCAGENSATVRAEISGGKAPFSTEWSTTDGALTTEDASQIVVSSLSAGLVEITVTDANGNTAAYNLDILQPEQILINVFAAQSASANGADGIAEVELSGGVPPFTYQWSNGETTQNVSSLSAGLYTVTATDANGCLAIGSVEMTENILPLAISDLVTTDITCFGGTTGSAAVQVTGGKGPYTIEWSNGSTEESLSDLAEGNYTVTVTDVFGTSVERSISISQPDEIAISVISSAAADANVSNGQAEIAITGGVAPYAISWSSGATVTSVSDLEPGENTVTVTDANGCSVSTVINISEEILPLSVNVERDVSGILCHGDARGMINTIPSGGKGPFTYTWSDNGPGTASRNDLAAGTYIVTVTDVNGSQATAEVPISEPEPLEVSADVIAPASPGEADGQGEVNITGGVPPYEIQWDNGESALRAIALGPGTHTAIIADANGCRTTVTLDISEQILPLAVNLTQTSDVLCHGDENAAISANQTGGKGPYEFSWSNGSASEDLTGIGAGSYTVTVTDASGQSVTASLNIDAPEQLQGEITDVRAAAAEHVADGRGFVQVSGGAGGYSYSWDNGENTQRATKLSIGAHTVTVTDANGCSIVLSCEVNKKILPALTAEALASGQAIRMEQLQFEADSTNINDESVPVLTELYQFLYDNPTIVVEIGGHTNGLPEHEYCDKLSTERAKAVAEWIVNQGIDEKRVYYKGYGKRRPIATNRTPEGRRKNQRVEVRTLALSEGQ